MKKITLIVLAVCCFTAGFTQTGKNGWEIGGHAKAKWYSQKVNNGDDKYHYNEFGLHPTIGYFICAKFVIGAALGYDCYSYHYNDDDPYKYNELLLGPFVKYYFKEPNQKSNFYAKAFYELGGWKPAGQDERYNSNSYGIGLGMVCFLNRYVGLTFGFDWTSHGGEYYQEYEQDEADRENGIGFCAGLQIFLDPCKKKAPMVR